MQCWNLSGAGILFFAESKISFLDTEMYDNENLGLVL